MESNSKNGNGLSKTDLFTKQLVFRGGLSPLFPMNKYASGNDRDPIMICDDVFTTGTSMLDFIHENYPDWSAGQGFCWVVSKTILVTNIPRVPALFQCQSLH